MKVEAAGSNPPEHPEDGVALSCGTSTGRPKAGWPVRLWHGALRVVSRIRALGLRNPVGRFDSCTTRLGKEWRRKGEPIGMMASAWNADEAQALAGSNPAPSADRQGCAPGRAACFQIRSRGFESFHPCLLRLPEASFSASSGIPWGTPCELRRFVYSEASVSTPQHDLSNRVASRLRSLPLTLSAIRRFA